MAAHIYVQPYKSYSNVFFMSMKWLQIENSMVKELDEVRIIMRTANVTSSGQYFRLRKTVAFILNQASAPPGTSLIS